MDNRTRIERMAFSHNNRGRGRTSLKDVTSPYIDIVTVQMERTVFSRSVILSITRGYVTLCVCERALESTL